jgi:hypothetical protein
LAVEAWTAVEGESRAKLEQKASDVAHQRNFDIALVSLIPETEEVEVVRVLQHLGGKPGMRWRQAPVKVRHGSALPEVELVPDLNIEGVARPGLGHRFACIPLAQGRILELGYQRDDIGTRAIGQQTADQLDNSERPCDIANQG